VFSVLKNLGGGTWGKTAQPGIPVKGRVLPSVLSVMEKLGHLSFFNGRGKIQRQGFLLAGMVQAVMIKQSKRSHNSVGLHHP